MYYKVVDYWPVTAVTLCPFGLHMMLYYKISLIQVKHCYLFSESHQV